MEQQNVEFSGQNNKIHKLWVSNGVFLLIPGSYDIGPSSIYSCSKDHILEHEFCHLGSWAVSEKFLKQRNVCLSMLLFGVFFCVLMGKI